ncbi:MAG: S9 family peptidase [Candidatus Acidiferrales bacterium]
MSENQVKAIAPPVAKRVPKVDVVHGDERNDDYFWLREKENPEVIAYLEAENAYTDAVLEPAAGLRERLYQEILGRIKQTDLSVPYREGEHFYYSRTEEGKQYPFYCRKHRSLEAEEQVILDVNRLAEGEKFMDVGLMDVTDDGQLMAYSTDNTGFRDYTLVVKDLRTGALLGERIEKVSTAAWAADNQTLFYVTEDDAKRAYRLWRHRLGDDVGRDALLYEETDELFRIGVWRTRSKAYLMLSISSHTTSEVRFLPAGAPQGEWRTIEPRAHDEEYDVEHRADQFYIRTSDRGRNFRIVTAPVASPGRAQWSELVPHRADVMLEDMDLFANHMVVREREANPEHPGAGLPHLRVTDLRTGEWHRVTFPEPAYEVAPGANAEFDTRAFRYHYQSLVTPPSVFDYDMETRAATLLKQIEVLGGYDATQYATERIVATAPDGMRIPVSLVYRKGLVRDGAAPCLLYGYGSYGIPMPASFSSNRYSLVDRGFVFAVAHIRGGGELGKPWHDAGKMMNKRNTFSDFIACAEHLAREKYTSHERLAITGGSAGGLLMGAVVNQRPDVARVVLSLVPFVDVINTMLDASLPLTVGEYEEWGNPNNKDEYDYMKTYCPYTNLQRKAYPTMLLRTSLNDSQVMYWEPAKYAAKLRALKTDANPLLFKINLDAGHGGSSGRYDALREVAYDYAFLVTQLGVEPGVFASQ